METLFILPGLFVLALVAAYHKSRKVAERNAKWEKEKNKYRYRDNRY